MLTPLAESFLKELAHYYERYQGFLVEKSKALGQIRECEEEIRHFQELIKDQGDFLAVATKLNSSFQHISEDMESRMAMYDQAMASAHTILRRNKQNLALAESNIQAIQEKIRSFIMILSGLNLTTEEQNLPNETKEN